MEPNRPPPVIDMTPDGQFTQPPTPRQPGLLDRVLARVGGVALLVALIAGGLVLASLAVVFVGLILPVLLVAGLIGAGSIWWRLRRARQQGRPVFVVMRR
ncbi:hypothetical protein HB662_04145 [Roseomonas frigidaquae]|uniref:Uncharacterized protein n=2 Tax=Falsiroseomonas frigidaquae TaxID=487318 RepID=A0ABX1EW79_9PROT|nr:hypothetical protein [Falsiroseomonas frigidaquae]